MTTAEKRNTFLRGKVGKYGACLFRGGNVKGREEKGGGGGFPSQNFAPHAFSPTQERAFFLEIIFSGICLQPYFFVSSMRLMYVVSGN